MKKLLVLSTVLVASLFADTLQGVEASFSKATQGKLLEEFNSQNPLKSQQQNSYIIKKGWNRLISTSNGIDVIRTFENISAVKFVVTYDKASNYWAGFTLEQEVLKDIKEMLLLKYLEPNITFFVLSTRDIKVDIKSSIPNIVCSKLIDNKKYITLRDSGIDLGMATSKRGDIAIKSRYHSHEYRGIYNDTRVLLIYPKLKHTSKSLLKYGPAEPTVMINYAKEYQNKKFFVYDYLEKKCYEGYFPSKSFPPVPVLRVLKD